MDKASKLMLSLPKELDAVLITSPENRLYFTGFSGDGVLLLTRNPFYFFAASQSYGAAGKSIRDMILLPLEEGLSALPEICEKYSVQRIAVEAESLPVARLKRLRGRYPQVEFLVDDRVDALIAKLRKRKTDYELDCIRAAQKITEAAFTKTLRSLKPTETERQLAAKLEYELRLLSGERNFVSVSRINGGSPTGDGEKSSGGDMFKGDVITFHLETSVKGYSCHMVRTLSVGNPPEELQLACDALLSVWSALLKTIRPGTFCGQIEKDCRELLEQRGYSPTFLRIVGHGIGAARREPPFFAPDSREELESGMVFFLSMALFVPGFGRVEIGDTLQVTETGCASLCTYPKGLVPETGSGVPNAASKNQED